MVVEMAPAGGNRHGADGGACIVARVASEFEVAAVELAGVGWPIFRVRPRDKRPMQAGWQSEATANQAEARGLWRLSPRANIGLATGRELWALDVDGEAGRAAVAALESRHGSLPATVTSITGSGGEHRLFAMPAGRIIRNSVRRLGSGLDTRGAGGFVVVPPSVHPSGNRYRWSPGLEPRSVPLARAPEWLFDLLDPPPPRRPVVPPTARVEGRSAYGVAALRHAIARVASAAPGARNSTLNAEAWSLGRLVAGGVLHPVAVATALASAGLAAGLDRREVERTLASGMRAGLAEPREARHA